MPKSKKRKGARKYSGTPERQAALAAAETRFTEADQAWMDALRARSAQVSRNAQFTVYGDLVPSAPDDAAQARELNRQAEIAAADRDRAGEALRAARVARETAYRRALARAKSAEAVTA